MDDWISVSEYLPEKDQDAWFLLHGYVFLGRYMGNNAFYGNQDGSGMVTTKQASHWKIAPKTK